MSVPVPWAGGKSLSVSGRAFKVGRREEIAPDWVSAALHIYALQGMFHCMRTTIDLGDELLRLAKRRAADDGIPLREVIESALRRYLGGGRRREGYRLQWRPERGKLQAGVNLDDRDGLFDLMDGRR